MTRLGLLVLTLALLGSLAHCASARAVAGPASEWGLGSLATRAYHAVFGPPASEYDTFQHAGRRSRVNNRPAVCILSQPDAELAPNGQSYIAASYVKFVEGAGARAIPVLHDEPEETQRTKYEACSALLIPGGDADLGPDSTFRISAKRFLDWAEDEHADGGYFPIWGTCLGFELLVAIYAGEGTLAEVSGRNHRETQRLETRPHHSRLLRALPPRLVRLLERDAVSYFNHGHALPLEAWSAAAGADDAGGAPLADSFDLLASAVTLDGTRVVSMFEHTSRPIYGVQWHPEKNLYEWTEEEDIPHSSEAARLAQAIANFVVDEARRSDHALPEDPAAAAQLLIYNYQPVPGVASENGLEADFEQIYVFPGSAASVWAAEARAAAASGADVDVDAVAKHHRHKHDDGSDSDDDDDDDDDNSDDDDDDHRAAKEADRVTTLPGAGILPFGLYAGYITVHASKHRQIFYVLAESKSEPDTKPVTMWMNGGPGCSSIGGGLMSEMGPFFPNEDGITLRPNPNTWTDLSNMLYAEIPAFVGFSKSDSEEDRTMGDSMIALDSLRFVLGFLQRFKSYRGREFNVAGESYAGHYVPNLAAMIQAWNRKDTGVVEAVPGGKARIPRHWFDDFADVGEINLRGIFLGNPWTHPQIDTTAELVSLWARCYISQDAMIGVLNHCDLTETLVPFKRAARALLDGSADGDGKDGDTTLDELHALVHAVVNSAARPEDTGRLWEDFAVDVARMDHKKDAEDGKDWELCKKAVELMDVDMGHINIYDLTVDVCPGPEHEEFALARALAGSGGGKGGALGLVHSVARMARANLGAGAGALSSARLRRRRGQAQLPYYAAKHGLRLRGDNGGDTPSGVPDLPGYDPCVHDEVAKYLNSRVVQEALHVIPKQDDADKAPDDSDNAGIMDWHICTPEDQIFYAKDDVLTPMLDVWRGILDEDPDINVAIFSGDMDGIVPTLGTRLWVQELGLEVKQHWQPWLDREGQVGGYTVVYDRLALLTVRGAGHMVPYTQPQRAHDMFEEFIKRGQKTDDDASGDAAAEAAA
ncbi:unnamed protein product [Pedinophyceae sp. YPF-701]|nr:unnamed protein product [Pedinophyceae sp. YPF-701]